MFRLQAVERRPVVPWVGVLLSASIVPTLACEPPTVTEKGSPVPAANVTSSPAPSGDGCENPQRSLDPEASPIQYIVSFPEAQQHYVQVAATFPTDGRSAIELMMATWTPGSYLIREYARNVERVVASDQGGGALSVEKVSKNRWRVATGGNAQVLVTYRVYGREMTVRNNWVEDDFALINGAPTFLTLVDGTTRRHDVRMSPPRAWRKVISALPNHKDSRLHFKAMDYDTLVDSPFLVGNPAIDTFEVEGKEHVLAHLGGDDVWDTARSRADVKRLVEEETAFWGQVPYERYVFLNLLTETYGGLEHRDSTVLMFSRWGSRDREQYLRWLGLVAHEFFHTWNVKRLRPVALGPFDYEREVRTPSMWVAEGVTSYYDDLTVHRAGLSTESEYLTALSQSMKAVMSGPGRLVQSLTDSSDDAWIKLYRRDENFINSGVNYYTKGALVAWLLDTEIRRATSFDKSLDDVMRRAYALYSGDCGYTEQQFRDVVNEVADKDMSDWLAGHLDTADELDFSPALEFYGLRFKPIEAKEASGPQSGDPWFGHRAPRLGVQTKNVEGRLVVAAVVAERSAARAGINVDDEIVALGGYRVLPGSFEQRLKQLRAGEQVPITLARRGRLIERELELDPPLEHEWSIEVDPDQTEEQTARRKAWLASQRPKS